jgi:hypothetical protein
VAMGIFTFPAVIAEVVPSGKRVFDGDLEHGIPSVAAHSI